MKYTITFLAFILQFWSNNMAAQNLRFYYTVSNVGTSSTASVYVYNIGPSAENLAGFSLDFYFDNTETTLTSYDLSPLTALGWAVNSTTANFVTLNNPTVTITHTGFRELSGVIDDNLVGTNILPGAPAILIANALFDNTIGTAAAGDAYLASTILNNHPALQYVGLPLSTNDFIVTGTPAQPLPLQLVDFWVRPGQNSINLSWISENETNFYGFEIERSTDELQFEKIGFEKGRGSAGKTEYSFADASVSKGLDYYYRLKMRDINGSFSYSAIKKARINGASIVKFYPNPATDQLTIEWDTQAVPDRIVVYDINGREQLSTTDLGEEGTTVNISTIPAGYYVLKAYTAQIEVSCFLFTKPRG